MANMPPESVWDYPRPPALEPHKGHVRIVHKGIILADSNKALRILETSHPPTYYLPLEDIQKQYLVPGFGRSYCEWKGVAAYYKLVMEGEEIEKVGWYYANPKPRYVGLKDYVCFYASKLDDCLVNDEKVQFQEGDFYGGWITSNLKGPFKGGPGTFGW